LFVLFVFFWCARCRLPGLSMFWLVAVCCCCVVVSCVVVFVLCAFFDNREQFSLVTTASSLDHFTCPAFAPNADTSRHEQTHGAMNDQFLEAIQTKLTGKSLFQCMDEAATIQ